MTEDEPAKTNGPSRRSLVFLGAFAGAVGVVVAMPFFYPFGRIFDPTVGGDTPTGLRTEFALGFIGGVLLSPVAGLIGGVVAFVLNGRRIGSVVALLMIGLVSAFAIGLLAALNGGVVDENDSLKSLQWVAALGALAGAVAVAFYVLGRRAILPKLASSSTS